MTKKSEVRSTTFPIAAPGSTLLTPAQVAEMLGISEATLAGWRSRGRYNLPYVKVGSRVMYRLQSVTDFVQDRERGANVSE